MSDYEKLVLEFRATLRKVAILSKQLHTTPVTTVYTDGSKRFRDMPVDDHGIEIVLPGKLVERASDGVMGTTICAETETGIDVRWNER